MRAGDIIGGKYRLEYPLGEGGLGVVWAGSQIGLNRLVAIKFIKGLPSATEAARFATEARALGQLQHPNCVTIFDFGRTEGGAPFIVMELLQGGTLADLRGTPQPIERVVGILRQIAAALGAAHETRIVHRDLKPENIALAQAAAGETVKVLDFGLAKMAGLHEADITKTGEVFGTTWYCSPEQLRGSRDVGPATDLYALGVIAFELVEGRRPFDGASAFDIALAHLKAPPPPITRADCPVALRTLIARLLEKDPGLRPAGARALVALLDRIDRPAVSGPRVAPAVSARPPWAGAAAVVLVLVVGSLAFWLKRPRHDEQAPLPSRVAPAAVESRGTALIRQPDVLPTKPDSGLGAPHSPDAGAPAADLGAVDGGTPGCGRPPAFLGVGEFESGRGRVVAVIPHSYEPHHPHPVVVMLHERTQGADNFLRDSRIDRVAEKEGFIVLIPNVDYVNSWQTPQELLRLQAAVDSAEQELCIDPGRIFAIGHVTGGEQTERLACELPLFAGIATTSTREIVGSLRCEAPVPYLQLSPLGDGYNPLEGGRACSGVVKVSLAAHEERWRKQNGCSGEPTITRRDGATCYAWACATPYVSCHVDGGHNWPYAGQRMLDVRKCDGERPRLEYAETIWAFFEGLPSRAP